MARPPRIPENQLYTAASGEEFENLLTSAEAFWPQQVLPPSDKVILVDVQVTDMRVALRTLAYAQAVRRVVPARLVAFAGIDERWRAEVWTDRDTEPIERMARAFGAELVLDFNQVVDELKGKDGEVELPHFTVGDRPLRVGPPLEGDPEWFETNVLASAARLLFVPRITPDMRESVEVRRLEERAREIARINAGILASWDVVEVVTSHVDYVDWGLLAEQALAAGVAVTHVQSTGSMKAYTVFPEHRTDDRPLRTHVTRSITDQFEKLVWPQRDALRAGAELTAWRSRQNLGRPSWWRGGGSKAEVQLRSDAERAAVRRHVAPRFGWDPATPVVAVFNHAVSDALWTNHEAFADLGDWFERTAEHAAAHPEVNWLFLDHPAQHRYDRSGFFEEIGARHAKHGHMVFRPSDSVTKTSLWSLTDLVLTVRGSVSNEFPAFGVPALQAGWSEWSGLGFSTVADTPEEFWAELERHIAALLRGESLITDEQVERARLWLWLYRSGADVVTPLVPPWYFNEPEILSQMVSGTMRQVELDADPLFVSVRRAQLRRDPWLTRVDLTAGDLADQVGASAAPTPAAGRPVDGWLSSSYDTPGGSVDLPVRITSGMHPAVRIADLFARGNAILGRISGDPAMLGIHVRDGAAGPIRVRLHLAIDPTTDSFREERVEEDEPPAVRRVQVVAQGVPREVVELRTAAAGGVPNAAGRYPAVVELELGADEVGEEGIVMVEFRDPEDSGRGPGVGMRMNYIVLERPDEPFQQPAREAADRPVPRSAPAPRRWWRRGR